VEALVMIGLFRLLKAEGISDDWIIQIAQGWTMLEYNNLSYWSAAVKRHCSHYNILWRHLQILIFLWFIIAISHPCLPHFFASYFPTTIGDGKEILLIIFSGTWSSWGMLHHPRKHRLNGRRTFKKLMHLTQQLVHFGVPTVYWILMTILL
jgi:hypothetical protein